jgi:AcrR family transcriptional regulator
MSSQASPGSRQGAPGPRTATRSRRERPAKPPLSRGAIVEAALEIVAEEGIDALTMRRLAHALDTGPASLYVYVANRDELWELVFDAAVGSIEIEPTDPSRWREQLHALAARMVDMMARRYPGMAKVAMAHIPVGDNVLRGAESMLSLLKAGGASDPAAAYALDLISSYTTAIAYEQTLYAQLYDDPEHAEREIAKIAERFASVDAERYPTIGSLRREMTSGDGDERFRLGLDVIINGLLSTPTEGRLTYRPGGRRP